MATRVLPAEAHLRLLLLLGVRLVGRYYSSSWRLASIGSIGENGKESINPLQKRHLALVSLHIKSSRALFQLGTVYTPTTYPPPSPGINAGTNFNKGDSDLASSMQGSIYSSSRPPSTRSHARKRSAHKQKFGDGDTSTSDLVRSQHMSVDAISSASSGQYAESDVYAVYDDPCKRRLLLILSHANDFPCSFSQRCSAYDIKSPSQLHI